MKTLRSIVCFHVSSPVHSSNWLKQSREKINTFELQDIYFGLEINMHSKLNLAI